jgi:hypothetical protein
MSAKHTPLVSGAYCSECGAYAQAIHLHQCPPPFQVKRDLELDFIATVFANDEAEAAEKYAEHLDSGFGGGPQERAIMARRPGAEHWKRFNITFDVTVDYFAHEQ